MASSNPAAADSKGDEDKELLGLVDDSKDQVIYESSIPLSPQWLYAKPNDSKETRPLSVHGSTTDSFQKDAWRLDGSQDKKEWRRSTPEIESARRWRDEERETSLLGRRDRRKEGDRETDYRKGDRRSENTSVISDARSIQSSDRRNEVPSRNTSNESRRDNKWSSRWGPEDKEKEAKLEKKTETEKDNDSHSEKQHIVSGLRPLSESDSRDKWRPRHRQETQSSGPSSYRAAPGFGVERGRIEGSTVGFAAGRGRSNPAAKISSALIIGAAPFKAELALGKSDPSPSAFQYPRGKLLDIYRMQKLSIIDISTGSLDEYIPVTQSDFVTPLAIVPPDDEEEAVLKDIWKGKITSSEASHSPSCEQFIGVSESDDSEIGKVKDASLISEKVDLLTPKISGYDASHDTSVSLDNHYKLDLEAHEVSATNKLGLVGNLDIRSNVKLDGESRTIPMDDIANLPDDSLNLLNSPFIKIPTSEVHENKTDVQLLGQDTPPGELSLFYLDPQGEVQGPFLELDIISWFEQGFFGIDLPVCLSDAPEGSSFQPLGEIMPFLKERLQYTPDSDGAEIFDNLSTDRGNMQGNAPDISQQWSHSFDSSDHHVKKNVGVEASVDTRDNRFQFPMEETFGISDAGGEIFQGSNELLYQGRHMTTMEKELLLPQSSSGHHYMEDMAETSLVSKKGTKDDDANPLGLLLSELEVSYPKHPLSLNIPRTENDAPINQAATPDFPFGHKLEQLNITTDTPITDVWPGNYRNDRLRFAGDGLESSHLSRLENDANHQSLDELMLLHQLQKQQQLEQRIQKQHLEQQIQQQQQLEQQRRQQQQLEQHLQKQQLEQHLQKQQLQQHLVHQNVDLLRPFLDEMRLSIHQQHSSNQPVQDMDHFLKLQYEQQVHLRQVQQQHQLQQQLHQQHVQMLRQQQQQQHHHQQNQQKLLLEQLLHQQLLESGLGTSNIDHRHADRMLDQLVLQQHLLNESQPQHHNLYDPTIEQLIQAKFGQKLNRRDHDDLSDILPLSRQRNMISSEQQLLLQLQQEQLQAQHLSVASRQQLGMDEDRQMRGIWSVDEPGQFIRSAASPHQGRSARLGELDILQPPYRASSFEEPSQLEQNFLLHQRLRQGHNDQLHSIGLVGKFPSGIHSHNHLSEDHTAVHREAMERHLSETKGQVPTNLLESHFHQLQIEAEKQRGRKMNVPFEELKMWAYSQSAMDCSVDPVADRVGLGKSLPEVSLYSKLRKEPNEQELNLNSKGDANFLDGSGRIAFSSGSASFKQRHPLSKIHERDQFTDSLTTDLSREGSDFLDVEGKMGKMQALSDNLRTHSAVDILEGSVRQVAGIENEAIKLLRHASSGHGSSFSNYEMGLESAPVEQMTNNRISNSFLKRTNVPQSASSQSTVPEVASGQLMRGKSTTSIASSDEAKRDSRGNPVLSYSESATANKKDVRSRRTSSTSDADISEPTFSDMLKSNKKTMPEADALAAADALETGGKGGKKKGKKGRQIDPSLLGFKVHSNRILMGEIQRADD